MNGKKILNFILNYAKSKYETEFRNLQNQRNEKVLF